MATTLERPSTPPPRSRIHTPTTPRHGTFEDNYRPYSPRKSSRISQQARVTHTPPRQISSQVRTMSTPQTSRTASAPSAVAGTPASSHTASKKRIPRTSTQLGEGRVAGALDFDPTTSASGAIGLPTPSRTDKMEAQQSALRNNGMLPTPVKTPQSARVTNLAVKGVARNIFPTRGGNIDEIMPSPRKKGNKKYSGFTINSFGAEEEDSPIPIYTDSQDRVPSPDTRVENPFYGESSSAPADSARRTSKRRKVAVRGEDDQDLEDLESRTDGLVYVFRGKKVFRKFSDSLDIDEGVPDEEEFSEAELGFSDLPNHQGPLTRSSVRPRLLFPSAHQIKEKEMRLLAAEEEEADTDIEIPVVASNKSRGYTAFKKSTPAAQMDDDIATPKAPRFAPRSPPTTGRATRSQKIDVSSTPDVSDDDGLATPPHNRTGSAKVSPFMGWQRTKSETAPNTKKRRASSLPRSPTGKRTRRI